jgi:hypothetical protein
MYRGGLNYVRYSVNDTAEHGDYTGGPRISTDQTRYTMKQMLKEIQNGTYAKSWIKENETGRRWFEALDGGNLTGCGKTNWLSTKHHDPWTREEGIHANRICQQAGA